MGAPKSILGTNHGNESVFSHLLDDFDRIKDTEGSDYESLILRSKVYTKAFAKVMSPTSENHFNEASTVTRFESTGGVNLQLGGSRLLRPEMSFSLDDLPLFIHAEHIKAPLHALHIVDVIAIANNDIHWTSPASSDVKEGDQIHMIQKLDDYHYRGRPLTTDGILRAPQIFHRMDIIPCFIATKGLVLETTKKSKLKISQGLPFKKGEDLHVNVINPRVLALFS